MAQRVHRHIGRIEPDGGDDLVYLAMIVLARIVTPRAAVALQEQRRIVGTAFRRRFQLGCQLHGDRHRIAFGLFRAPVSAAAFGGLRHHQFRPHRMIVQILDAQTHGLARSCAGYRQRIGQQPELMIKPIGDADEFAHLVVRDDDVARLLRIRQIGKSDFPCLPVLNALVVLRSPIPTRRTGNGQSRLMVAGAIVPSRPSRHFFSSVAASNATGFDNSTLVRCRRGHVGVVGVGTARRQIAPVVLQRAVHGDRCGVGAAVLAARQLLRGSCASKNVSTFLPLAPRSRRPAAMALVQYAP